MKTETDFKGFLVKAQNCIDGLERQRDRLKARVADLESENISLRNRIAGLENRTMSEQGIEAMGYMKLPVGRDGKPVRIGETVYGGDGRGWKVVAITCNRSHPVFAFDVAKFGLQRDLKSGWLTHEQPQRHPLDADGVECHVGDKVWPLDGGSKGEVIGIEDNGAINVGWRIGVTACEDPKMFTHAEPDSWEKLERDISQGLTSYQESVLGKPSVSSLDGYPSPSYTDDAMVASDIVRRAKALAGATPKCSEATPKGGDAE